MSNRIRTQEEILNKLQIKQLHPMQEEALAVIPATANTIILSPTGTGKTLAFVLPLLSLLDPTIHEVQALILVPSRELAIQIEQVIRAMGSGYKVNAVYGGRPISKDKIELKHNPAILIGTPGRIADHFSQDRFSLDYIKTLILDEFDKSLETGFEYEMRDIIDALPSVEKRILTSATQGVEIPRFANVKQPKTIDYLDQKKSKLTLQAIEYPHQSKDEMFIKILQSLGNQSGIVFCNLRNTIEDVSALLEKYNIPHACFYGGMEQKDRERSLIKFRNGTHQLLVATDLAARGIDIPELKFILHYDLPYSFEEFTHRNGRTARVDANGTAYLLKDKQRNLPDFIKKVPIARVGTSLQREPQYWETLFISGGRKDKISKGDIAGLFFKQGNLLKEQLGVIELKQDCAFVAVPKSLAKQLINKLNNSRLKKKKVRITII